MNPWLQIFIIFVVLGIVSLLIGLLNSAKEKQWTICGDCGVFHKLETGAMSDKEPEDWDGIIKYETCSDCASKVHASKTLSLLILVSLSCGSLGAAESENKPDKRAGAVLKTDRSFGIGEHALCFPPACNPLEKGSAPKGRAVAGPRNTGTILNLSGVDGDTRKNGDMAKQLGLFRSAICPGWHLGSRTSALMRSGTVEMIQETNAKPVQFRPQVHTLGAGHGAESGSGALVLIRGREYRAGLISSREPVIRGASWVTPSDTRKGIAHAQTPSGNTPASARFNHSSLRRLRLARLLFVRK